MGTEYERKYLIKELPPVESIYKVELISQGYFATASKYESIRIRMPIEGPILLTFKAGTGEAKTEIETEIPEKVGRDLFTQTKFRIHKRRLHIVDPAWNWSPSNDPFLPTSKFASRVQMTLDLFYGDWSDDDFYGALFEAETPSKGFPVTLPPWVGEDVTDDPRYNNAAIARDGWPEK